MSKLLRTTFLLLTTCGLSSAAIAQNDGPEDENGPEPLRRYTVEVIIFSYAEDFGRGSELFYPDRPEVDAAAAAELGLVDEVEVTPARPSTNLAILAANRDALRFVPLPEAEYTLTNVVDRLELLDAYDTLMHFGWTQPTLPPEYTRPVSLHTFGTPPARLDGRFELYLSRYLHLVVDLALAAEDGPDVVTARPGIGAFGGEPAVPVYYRIQEDRIFKNGDIRYFDHPKFGVIAKVTRVEEASEAPAGNGALPGLTGQ